MHYTAMEMRTPPPLSMWPGGDTRPLRSFVEEIYEIAEGGDSGVRNLCPGKGRSPGHLP